MSSQLGFIATVRQEGKITIDSNIREVLKLKPGDTVSVTISKPTWHELIDWEKMDGSMVNFNDLPENIQSYITSNYSVDSHGNTWGGTT